MTTTVNHTIRIAIVDDHGIVRQGLRMLLTRPGIDVVAEGCSGEEAVQIAQQEKPDVILLDIRMKDGDGLSYLPKICEVAPNTRVIMLTTYANPGYLARAINDGACGYLLKETDPDRIIDAIYAAMSDNSLFDKGLLGQALENAIDERTPDPEPIALPHEALSEREVDVIKLIALGMTNASIGKALNISVPTVKTHVQHIFQKLNVADRTQAALWAVREGIAE